MNLVDKIVTGLKEDTLFCVAEATVPNGCVFPALFDKANGHFIKMVIEKDNRKIIKLLRFRNEPAPWEGTKLEKDGGTDEIQFT